MELMTFFFIVSCFEFETLFAFVTFLSSRKVARCLRHITIAV